MDLSQLKAISDFAGWPAVVVILLIIGTVGLFVFNHRIEAKNDVIEKKNEHIAYIELKLKEADNFNPDRVIQRLGERHAILSKEVESLIESNEENQKTLAVKQNELAASRLEIEKISKRLNQILSETEGLICPYCGMPLASKTYLHFYPGDDDPLEVHYNVVSTEEVLTYMCGLKVVGGKEEVMCSNRLSDVDY